MDRKGKKRGLWKKRKASEEKEKKEKEKKKASEKEWNTDGLLKVDMEY